MDVRKLMTRFATASDEERKRISQLQADQAARDEERAKREIRQEVRDERRATRERLQTCFQAIQLVAIVLAAAAVIISWNATKKQDEESRYSSISQTSLEVEKEIASHPRLLSCFLDKECKAKVEPPLNAQDLEQALALASYIVDFYQYAYTELDRLGQAPDSGLFTLRKDAVPGEVDEGWVSWSETIVDGFKYSSLVCQALIDYVPAYDQAFVHAVAKTGVCKNLSDPGPSPY